MKKTLWWNSWCGAPVAFFMCVLGFVFHPRFCVSEFLFYYDFNKKSRFPVSIWDVCVRACTDIDMST